MERFCWIPLAAVLVLGGCNGDLDRHRPQDRPSPSRAPADTSALSGGDLSSFSGRIAFDNFKDVWTIDADGTDLTRLTRAPYPEFDPSWSPDGSRIAFNSNLTGDHVMYIAHADGSKVVDLSHVGEGWQVDWSPDGRSILFTSHRDHPDNYTDVYVMRPDGSGIRRLTNNLGYTPAWSPDGEHIVFSAPGLFIMDPDGSDARAFPPLEPGETALADWTD
jgi:TolB protein